MALICREAVRCGLAGGGFGNRRDSCKRLREWSQEGDRLPFVSPVDEKVTVQREHNAGRMDFTHSHETDIGKRGRKVPVLAKQSSQGRDLVRQIKLAEQVAAFDHRENPIRVQPVALEQEKNLGDDRLAAEEWVVQLLELVPHPAVLPGTPVEIGDERPGVCNYCCHEPNPFMCLGLVARSSRPLDPAPQRSFVRS